MKERSSRRLLGVVLGVLCLAIVGLTVGIVVVNVKNNKVVEGELSMEEQLNSVGMRDIDARIAIYQEFIDKAEGEELLQLLKERTDYVLSVDTMHEYGDVVIADAIRVDDMIKSMESAIGVVNIALSYQNDEIADTYSSAIAERQSIVDIQSADKEGI